MNLNPSFTKKALLETQQKLLVILSSISEQKNYSILMKQKNLIQFYN